MSEGAASVRRIAGRRSALRAWAEDMAASHRDCTERRLRERDSKRARPLSRFERRFCTLAIHGAAILTGILILGAFR